MRKKLFNADYEASTKLVTRKRLKLKEESFKYMKFSQRIYLPFLVSFFIVPGFYIIGTQMPLGISDKVNYFSDVMAKYGTIFSDVIKLVLLIWIVMSILFLIPHKNYGSYVIFAYFVFLPMIISFDFILFDFSFGASVAGVGLVGSMILIVGGLIYVSIATYNIVRSMKSLMYREEKKTISMKWYLRITFFAVILTVIGSLVSPPKEFNLLLYVSAFVVLVAFAGIAFLTRIMLRMFVMFYYFSKYGEQYKEKFKITDEQWYGPRKAKRLAKKKGK